MTFAVSLSDHNIHQLVLIGKLIDIMLDIIILNGYHYDWKCESVIRRVIEDTERYV